MRCPRCYRYGAPTAIVRQLWNGEVVEIETGNARDVVPDPACETCGGLGYVLVEVETPGM